MPDTYDLYIKAKDPDSVVGFKFFTTGFKRTVGVRGPYKLIVQWIKRFMTTKGSDPTNLEEGTDFPSLIGSNIVSMADIRDVVMLSIQDCNSQIEAAQRETRPDEDEQLESAVLTRFQAWGKDGFEAWVTITNVAGASVTVRLPDLATRT